MKRQRRRNRLHQPGFTQIFALFLCLMLLSSSYPAVAAAEPAKNRTVKAGVFFFDGYHMRDGDGNYTGYGIELLNLISQYSHLNFEFVGYDNTWEEMQTMLLNGEIDVVTSARKTRARAEVFGFSIPIEHNSTVLSVLESNIGIISGNYRTYDGMTVGVLAGSSQNQSLSRFAEANGFTCQTREYETSGQLEEALQRGEIDAILTSNLRKAEGERVLDTTNIEYFYAITRKEDQDLLSEINYALAQMNLHEGDYWANDLYNKYYGSGVSYIHNVGFNQREREYIEAAASGKKRITVTAMPDQRPYSYVENGELKGILPQFFDRLMRIPGLSYEVIVPRNRAEYDQLRSNGSVDVVIDWHQTTAAERNYADGGFLTNSYLNTGTALVIRKDFGGSVSSLAIVEDQEYLPLEYERFQNASIKSYPVMADAVQAVLDGEADAAFMRTYSAQYFVNNDRTDSLRFDTIDSDQTVFSMFIPSSSDHELITILNKCIQQAPDDVLSRLISEYTARTAENMSFYQYMSAHPETILLLSAASLLAISVIFFLFLRSRWNRKLLYAAEQANQKLEQANQELEEQLAIVNALTQDLLTIYKLDMQDESVVALKLDEYMPSGMDWTSGKAFPYAEALHRYIDEWIQKEDRDELKTALSLDHLREELSRRPVYTGNYRACLDGELHDFQFVCVAYRTNGQTTSHALIGFRDIE